jgi:hypothetical protein
MLGYDRRRFKKLRELELRSGIHATWHQSQPCLLRDGGSSSASSLDTMAAAHPRPLGVLHPQLPWLCPVRLPHYPLQTILR